MNGTNYEVPHCGAFSTPHSHPSWAQKFASGSCFQIPFTWIPPSYYPLKWLSISLLQGPLILSSHIADGPSLIFLKLVYKYRFIINQIIIKVAGMYPR